MTLTLAESNGRYQAMSTIEATGPAKLFAGGSLDESSMFRADADYLRPISYQRENDLRGDPERFSMDFDWEKRTVNMQTGTEPSFEAALSGEGPIVDRQTIIFELIRRASLSETQSAIYLIDDDGVREVAVSVMAPQSVIVPAGKFKTTPLTHQSVGSERRTSMWLAPSLNYIPVKIEQFKGKKLVVRAELVEYVPIRTDVE